MVTVGAPCRSIAESNRLIRVSQRARSPLVLHKRSDSERPRLPPLLCALRASVVYPSYGVRRCLRCTHSAVVSLPQNCRSSAPAAIASPPPPPNSTSTTRTPRSLPRTRPRPDADIASTGSPQTHPRPPHKSTRSLFANPMSACCTSPISAAFGHNPSVIRHPPLPSFSQNRSSSPEPNSQNSPCSGTFAAGASG